SVGHSHEFCLIAQKPPGQRTDAQNRRFGGAIGSKPVVSPNLAEPLPLALVVAENMDAKPLPNPAMKLIEEFPALRFGHVRFRCPRCQWSKGIEALKPRTTGAIEEVRLNGGTIGDHPQGCFL